MQHQETRTVFANDRVKKQAGLRLSMQDRAKHSSRKGALSLLQNASIRRKIGVGYALCVGIAILGTTVGLALGEHYQDQAIAQLNRTRQQEYLLKELQTALLEARSHSSRFAVVLGDSIWLSYETAGFDQSIRQSKQLLVQTQSFVKNLDDTGITNTQQLHSLLRTYAITLDAYQALNKSLLQQINASNLKPDEIVSAQQQLLSNNNGEVAITLDRISQQLSEQIQAAQAQNQEAAARLRHAGGLRVAIIVASMLLSLVIAAVLALYTSKAIAQPIRGVTKVAQQVAEESNFALRAAVTSSDEVGILATSLNQLIQRIAAYTQELKQAQAQLIQTEKMSSLGAMVAGVAHEINNPINFIYGNIEYTSDYIQDLLILLRLYQQHYPVPSEAIQHQLEVIDFDFLSDDLPKILSSMKGGANRIQEIVLSLRNFSRLDETGRKSVNIHEGIENTLLILSSRLRGIEVIKQYGELPFIECSPGQLNQVFMNLLCNAIDALELETRDWALEARGDDEGVNHSALLNSSYPSPSLPIPTIRISTEVVNQDRVVIKIADNGTGIPAAIKDQIFDPFFTTKQPGKGTGLGLAISYQIITHHQGKIEAISTPGKGTEFIITLPVGVSTVGE